MEGTAQRRAVDVGPVESRPGLALGLAILSVPGSTLAWDLPAGGYWIGLPLAVAAIVIARRSNRSTMATAAIVIAGLMIAQMVAWTAVSLVS